MSSEDLRKWGCWIPEDDPSDGEPDDSEPETDEPGLAEPEPAEPEPEPEPEPAEPEPAAPAPSDWADRAVEGDVASTLREQLGAWRRTDTELRTRASRSLSARATIRDSGSDNSSARAAVVATNGADAPPPVSISAPPVTVAAVLPRIDARGVAVTASAAPSADSSAKPETGGEALPAAETASAKGAYAQSDSLQAMRTKFARARAELHNALSGEEEDLGNPTFEAASPYWNCDVCRFRNREEEDEVDDEASAQHRLRHRNASTWFCARCGFARGAVDLPDLSQQPVEVTAGGGAETQPQLEVVCAPLAIPKSKTEPVDDESRIDPEPEPQPQLEIVCAPLAVPESKAEPGDDESRTDSAASPPLPPHEEAAENPRDDEPPARTFKCAKCSRTFTSRVHLRIHGATHARPVEQASAPTPPTPTKPAEHEAEPTTTQPEQRPRTPEEMMPFSCTLCGRKFRNAYHMKTHAAVHRRQAECANDEMRRMVAEFESNE